MNPDFKAKIIETQLKFCEVINNHKVSLKL